MSGRIHQKYVESSGWFRVAKLCSIGVSAANAPGAISGPWRQTIRRKSTGTASRLGVLLREACWDTMDDGVRKPTEQGRLRRWGRDEDVFGKVHARGCCMALLVHIERCWRWLACSVDGRGAMQCQILSALLDLGVESRVEKLKMQHA